MTHPDVTRTAPIPSRTANACAQVVVFDSGVGGLSICEQLFTLNPNLHVHYIMDNAAFPYGLLDDATLLQRVVAICTQAAERWQPDAIVIACNTASTLVLPPLRAALSIPIIGVVPAIKVAAQRTRTAHIGLIATPATINRSYTDTLIDQFAHHVTVRKLGSEPMIRWGQQLLEHGAPTTADALTKPLYEHLAPWLNAPEPLTHVVLGCTHFPLLAPYLRQLWPDIDWIDSGSAIANRLQQVLPTPQAYALTPGLCLHATQALASTQAITRFVEGFTTFHDEYAFEYPFTIGTNS